jgi:hypothetical protein
VDQVSRPLIALLLATVGLAGTWMAVLRPHHASSNADAPLVAPSHTAPKHTAPGAAGLGRAIDHAKGATSAANASVNRTQSAAAHADTAPAAKPAVPAKPATPAKPAVTHAAPVKHAAAPVTHTAPVKHATAPKTSAPVTHVAPAKPVTPAEPGSARVNQALAAGKSVVLLFAGDGADDTVARQVVRSMHVKNVVTIVTSITQLTRYDSVLTNVDVSAAPTIVVIGPKRQATSIVGLPDIKQIQSALRTVS